MYKVGRLSRQLLWVACVTAVTSVVTCFVNAWFHRDNGVADVSLNETPLCHASKSSATNIAPQYVVDMGKMSRSIGTDEKNGGLKKYTVEERFPGGRIFTYQYVTNANNTKVHITRARVISSSKPHESSDVWGVVSNTYALSRCVSDARDKYAHGQYLEALRLAEAATNVLAEILFQSGYTNYIFDWALINDLTFVSEVFAEKAISDGRYTDAKKIAKWGIDEYPIAPPRLAAIYLAADMLSGERSWLFSEEVTLNVSNGVSKIIWRESTSYVRWEDAFEFDSNEVNRQLALWGYVYPLLAVDNGNDFIELNYSELLGLPDNLPYPQLKRRWIVFGDYYGNRWKGFGKYEEYNLSEMLRESCKVSDRLKRDGISH